MPMEDSGEDDYLSCGNEHTWSEPDAEDTYCEMCAVQKWVDIKLKGLQAQVELLKTRLAKFMPEGYDV